MTEKRRQREMKLFKQALAKPADERARFLDEACGLDGELRREVELLLSRAGHAADELKGPPDGFPGAVGEADTHSMPVTSQSSGYSPAIEGYEIVRELHRGGQGVVYQALQKSTKRKVAIKVLLEGPYATAKARRRFEREIELVASLKHPNIVAVFHSGQTKDGRQFCIMDYVRGVPLNEYVRDKKLTLEEALKLFATVCEAVNYAHQKGVIHRDLKPSNILVDVDGRPKVLDFGLAKMLGGPEETMISVTGQVVGTLPYLSPEQARGNPDEIDIRTDVYALGVILYELMTGQYPYPVIGQMADVLRNIIDAQPTPPSKQWTSGSGVTQRHGKRQRIGRCPIDDEIETIMLRSLAKERERRYQSAGAVASDLRHYLAHEPIEAKRDSGWYLLRVTLRRHRVGVALAALFLVLILSSAVVQSIMYGRAERARREADAALKRESAARAAEARQRAAAEENRLLAEQRYEEIIRLADLKRLSDARAAADELWPAYPDKIEEMTKWLLECAEPLQDNLPKHEATLLALRDQALDYDSGQQNNDRETHPKAAELAAGEKRLTELRRQLEQMRARGTETAKDTEVKTGDIDNLKKTIGETEYRVAELKDVVKGRRTWRFGDDQTQWQHDTLAGLVEDLRRFVDADSTKGTLASVERRLEFARKIEGRSVTGTEAATKWAEAIADVRRLDVYGGLKLKPQIGLLPLRRDPQSGLWEFWHLQTGAKPVPNPDPIAVNPWVLTEDTGLIFVLIPGGSFWMGAQADDPDGRNYDPQANADESPVHEVTLVPFFVSKYEMTQAQWRRFTGSNPSYYDETWVWPGEPPTSDPVQQNRPWNPVEHIAWTDCQEVLRRLDLLLPTEAQWEYAARAGAGTVWWTGDKRESIGAAKAGNLADGWTKSKGGPTSWSYEEWLSDGWAVHAPVGSFVANGFGLHDVIGNVWEWCRDDYCSYEAEVKPGDGLRRPPGPQDRVRRGGSFNFTADSARSAERFANPPEYRALFIGVRPARNMVE